jgi:hypothetical protein
MTALQQKSVGDDEKRKMIDILKRAQENSIDESLDSDDEDDDNEDDPAVRFADLNLDDNGDVEALWARLTPAERKEFQKQLQGGLLTADIEPWVPWWVLPPTPLIQELGSPNGEGLSDKSSSKPENGLQKPHVPPLETLLKKPPAAEMANNLISILMAYAFSRRMFNGDTDAETLPLLIQLCVQTSSVLESNAVFASPALAAQAMVSCVHTDASLSSSAMLAVVAIQDAALIMAQTPYVQRVLCELHAWFSRAKIDAALKTTLSANRKKMVFYLSWWAWFCMQTQFPATKLLLTTLLKQEHDRMILDFSMTSTTSLKVCEIFV